MGTKYKDLQRLVNNSKLSKSKLKSSNLYRYIKSLNVFKDNQIFFANITSMSLDTNPNMLRIRSDNFLKKINNNEKAILLSGINWNNKQIILVFLSESFIGYNHSIDSSNSFITFSKNDLDNFLFNNEDTVNFKNIYKNTKKERSKYIFYTTEDINFDQDKFFNFYDVLVNDLKFQPYSQNTNQSLKNLIPPIPERIKKMIRELFNQRCALCSIHKDNLAFCPCGEGVNTKYLEDNGLSYTDIHHFIPKEYFLNYMSEDSYIDWNVVHNEINLIPLCSACHQAIHKGNKYQELVKNTFNAITNAFEEKDRFKKFENYLLNNTNLRDLRNLLFFYFN